VPPVVPIENTLDPKHTLALTSTARACEAARDRRVRGPCSSSKAALWTGGAQRCISTLETPPATPTTPPPPARMIVFGTAMRGGAQQRQHSQRINPSSSRQLRQQTCNGTQARRAYYE